MWMWAQADVCRPEGLCTTEKLNIWTWSFRSSWLQFIFCLLAVITACLAEYTVGDVAHYKGSETVRMYDHRQNDLWIQVVSPAAGVPLLVAAGWICSKSGRFAVILELLLLLFVIVGVVWVSVDSNVFIPLLAIQGSFVAPGLLAAAVLYMYESIPLGKRLVCMLSIPLSSSLARLISVSVNTVVANSRRYEILVDSNVIELASRAISANFGMLIGFAGLTGLVGLLFVRHDTALGLVARGYSADAFRALAGSGEAPMHKEVYIARVEAEEIREQPSLSGPIGLLVLLVAAQVTLATSFLDTFGHIAESAFLQSLDSSPIVVQSVQLGVVTLVSVVALILWLKVGQVRYLPSAMMVAAAIGAVVCASLPLPYPEAGRFAWLVSPPSAMVGLVCILLGLPLLEWTIWVLACDLFSSKRRPWGVFGVAALRGIFRTPIRYQLWADVFETGVFVAEAIYISLCSGFVMWAFYQTRWFDRSLLCVDDAESGWLESDERLRPAIVARDDSSEALLSEPLMSDPDWDPPLVDFSAAHGPTSSISPVSRSQIHSASVSRLN